MSEFATEAIGDANQAKEIQKKSKYEKESNGMYI
jgi:hypothetical protein